MHVNRTSVDRGESFVQLIISLNSQVAIAGFHQQFKVNSTTMWEMKSADVDNYHVIFQTPVLSWCLATMSTSVNPASEAPDCSVMAFLVVREGAREGNNVHGTSDVTNTLVP